LTYMPSEKMMDFIPLTESKTQVPAYLSRPGGMSERIRDFNWAETSLGTVDKWKQSLRSALSICLNSNFPIAIYWGKELCLLYNDAWSPIPGNKHPWALGRPAKEVWPEIWNDIEPQFAKAFSGEPGGSKDALLPMQRHGYTEECYFDFTFTPVYGEEGNVDGIFNAVIETTYQLINERRSALLQKLSRKIIGAISAEDVFQKVTSLLKINSADIPFCFIYTLSGERKPQLAAGTSNETQVMDLPIQDLITDGSSLHLPNIQKYLDKIPVSFWPETPLEAMLVPLRSNNGTVTGFLFTGLSARRRFDREYQLFIEQVAGIISSSLNTIHSLEEGRKRAEAIIISAKKLEESETALRLANEQLELTFRNVPAAIYLFDKEGKILFLNTEAANLNGLIPEENDTQKIHLNGYHNSVTELFKITNEAGDLLSMEDTPTAITLRTGKAAQKIMHFIEKSDRIHKWILTSTSPLLNEDGELVMVLTTSTDITSQKLAEEKIRESEQHFRNLTQALPQLVWVTDAAGKQEFVTERWKEYTGLDPYDNDTWARMVHPDDLNILAKAWNNSRQTGTTYKAEARLKGRDGKFRWFHVHGEPILSEKKEIIQWVGAFTDIHEQKSAEELLRLSEEKLEFLVKKRTEQLERSNEDLQQFAHVASHDLKEPIRKIKIFSSLLQEEFNTEFNAQAKLYLSKIQSATERMLLMMEGVLRYAALDGYQQGLDKVDLNEILRSVETDLEMVIQKRKAIMKWDSLPEIQGYPVLIYQLFYNLISNALKFSRTDIPPDIRIIYNKVLIHNEDFAQFRIIDNGIGFEPVYAEKIFHSFARLNPKEDYEGTGLGLSLCKKIVTRHQGFLTASGNPGLGAEFIVELPFIQTD
jgi:PAS domain S-box-containing protein